MTNIQNRIYNAVQPSAKKAGPLIMLALVITQVLFFVILLTVRKSFLVIASVLLAAEFIVYVIYKDLVGTGNKRKLLNYLKVSLAVYAGTLFAMPFAGLSKIVSAQEQGATGAMTVAMTIMAMVGAALAVALCVSEAGQKMFKSIDEKFKLGDENKDPFANEDPGYVVLCKDYDKVAALFPNSDPDELEELCLDQKLVAETAKKKGINLEEIIPYEDRFLHVLVLGPTGCGKTSQILIPMCLQDIRNPNMGVTVLDPKGDFAQKTAMIAKMEGRPFLYFDPSIKGCPHFNPLAGKEVDVVENMATTFRMLNPDSPTFFLDMDEQLIRNAVKVLKRLDKDCGVEGTYANLIQLSRLLQNSGGAGRKLVQELSKVSSPTPEEAKENTDIIAWFQNDYFAERSKVYENTSEVRSQVAKITSNEYLRDVLNPDPSKGEKNDLDFDKHLEEGGVICISTAQGTLRGLSKFLGKMGMSNRYKRSVVLLLV